MTARTVMVVHREPLVAEAIASALDRHPWLAPVAVASRAEDALGTRVEAVVLDGRLPGSADVARQLVARRRRVAVLVEAGDGSAEDVPHVSTDATMHRLACVLAPGIDAVRPEPTLTRREREILGLVAKGFAGKQVATALGISPKTVEGHKTRIFSKLGVANQAAAVAAAARQPEEVTWIPSPS